MPLDYAGFVVVLHGHAVSVRAWEEGRRVCTHCFAVSLNGQECVSVPQNQRAMMIRQQGMEKRTHDDGHDGLSSHLLARSSGLYEPRKKKRMSSRAERAGGAVRTAEVWVGGERRE